jgi:hypothetical protein
MDDRQRHMETTVDARRLETMDARLETMDARDRVWTLPRDQGHSRPKPIDKTFFLNVCWLATIV